MRALKVPLRSLARRDHGSPRAAASPRRRASIGLWAPLTPLAVVLSPLALAMIPILELVARRRGFHPARAVLALGAVLMALSGTIIEVDSPQVRIRIRIF